MNRYRVPIFTNIQLRKYVEVEAVSENAAVVDVMHLIRRAEKDEELDNPIVADLTDDAIHEAVARLRDGSDELTWRPGIVEDTGVLVSAIIEDYIEYANEHLKTGSIIEQVLKANFLTHSIAKRKAASITTADLKRYRQEREAEGVMPATIKNELSYLRAAFFRAKNEHTPPKISEVPHFPIPSVENTRTGFLEFEHYEALLSELPDSVKLAFVVAYHVGDRKGELLDIDLDQVQLEDGFIVLDHTDVKNETGRNLPIYGDMEKWLKWQLAIRAKLKPDHTKLFFWHPGDVVIGHGGNRKAPGSQIKDFRASWNSAVERMVTKTGQKQYAGLLFHDLRRSAVRNMVQKAGIPEVQAMKISGHKTASMLHRYNIVARQDVAEAGKKLNAWMAGKRKSA